MKEDYTNDCLSAQVLPTVLAESTAQLKLQCEDALSHTYPLSAGGELFLDHAQKIIDLVNDAKAFSTQGTPRGRGLWNA